MTKRNRQTDWDAGKGRGKKVERSKDASPPDEPRRFRKKEIPQRCPACGSERVAPIIYGYPSAEAGAAAERGELVLGGCMVWFGAPQWECLACGARDSSEEMPGKE